LLGGQARTSTPNLAFSFRHNGKVTAAGATPCPSRRLHIRAAPPISLAALPRITLRACSSWKFSALAKTSSARARISLASDRSCLSVSDIVGGHARPQAPKGRISPLTIAISEHRPAVPHHHQHGSEPSMALAFCKTKAGICSCVKSNCSRSSSFACGRPLPGDRVASASAMSCCDAALAA